MTQNSLSKYQLLFDKLAGMPVFGLDRAQKNDALGSIMAALELHHTSSCQEFRNISTDTEELSRDCDDPIAHLNSIAVRLFKLLELKSIPSSEIYRTLQSSGTTSQVTAKVVLDRQTSQRQSKVLVSILQNVLGRKRLPMLIIDAPSTVAGDATFNARAAGIQGLAFLGRDHTYALNDDMSINWEQVSHFCDKYRDSSVMVFGFTFMIWKYWLQNIDKNNKLDLANGILLHSGGWKKLEAEKVDNHTFKETVKELTGIGKVHNFYGMAEQVGSIFLECSEGHLHASSFADVLIRKTEDLALESHGKPGLIQVLSAVPTSYPGHSVLTEDIGVLLGEDDCPCGWKGKYFEVLGRLPKTEIRGCSDTHDVSV
jgi:hypothetical protein